MLRKFICWLGFHDHEKVIGQYNGLPFPPVKGAPVCKHCGVIEYWYWY